MWDRRWIEALRKQDVAHKLGRRFLLALLSYATLKYVHFRHSRIGNKEGCQAAEIAPTKDKTVLSQRSLQFLLAFVAGWFDVICFKQYKCYANMMTGNTVNLCYKIGNFDRADVSFLAAAIVQFCGGFTAFRYVDMKLSGRGSCTAVAPLIFLLFSIADILRSKFPKSRWHMLPLALACGMVNSISAEKGKIVTNMMTGHFQSLSSIFADFLFKGLTSQQKASSIDSIRMIATFCSAICIGMAAGNLNYAFTTLERRKYAIFGAIYAAILVLHELPMEVLKSGSNSPIQQPVQEA